MLRNHLESVRNFNVEAAVTYLVGQLPAGNSWPTALFGGWLLSMILLPIAKWGWGDTALEWGVLLSVLLQTGLVLVILGGVWEVAKLLRIAIILLLMTFLIEAIGTATGWPFGAYHYTTQLQPQLAGVPLLIPLAWLMMLPVAWAVAYGLTGETSGWRFVGMSALAFTAWDLFLDPQMAAWGFWVWDQPGGYFGIPWQNFLGWAIIAALVTVLAQPREAPPKVLIAIYVAVWLLEAIGLLFFWKLPGPALAGAIGMGSFIFLLWFVEARRRAC
ncbi:MAG: carotenoid biosynthesis protein [Anaerolineae bacterium]|nr:carotenoid biosynthesis protein [Anaerolineae bacterium]